MAAEPGRADTGGDGHTVPAHDVPAHDVPAHAAPAHATPALTEAARLMTICNACRYCEGLCPVFPAMERRRLFTDGDLDFLANLCHNCGACLYDCQYAPPHAFDVGVPSNLAELRAETWQRYAWPRALAPLLRRAGLTAIAATVAAIAGFVAAVVWRLGDAATEPVTGPGAFYAVVPHGAIVTVFGFALVAALAALAVSLRRYWRAIGGGRVRMADLASAGASASTLEHLDGGGVGCMNVDETPDDDRRLYHHATYYGFAACLASTTLAAILDTGFGLHAPYPWYHPVVVLGSVGGLGLLIGPAGLLRAKLQRDPALGDPGSRPMDLGLLAMLALLSVTGFAVLLLRSTGAMPLALAAHLGVVLAFFVTIPTGKFVHGFYRYAALVRDRQEAAPPRG